MLPADRGTASPCRKFFNVYVFTEAAQSIGNERPDVGKGKYSPPKMPTVVNEGVRQHPVGVAQSMHKGRGSKLLAASSLQLAEGHRCEDAWPA